MIGRWVAVILPNRWEHPFLSPREMMRILWKIASDDNPAWRKLGKLALEKAVETVVEEGIEAAVEIWKKRQLKFQDEFFENRDTGSDAAERKEYPTREDDDIPADETDDADESDGSDDDSDGDGDSGDQEPVGGDSANTLLVGHDFDSLADYAG